MLLLPYKPLMQVRFHITHGYAHLGYSSAQHLVGIHYREAPMSHLFVCSRAAAQGHARASYEIVIAPSIAFDVGSLSSGLNCGQLSLFTYLENGLEAYQAYLSFSILC
uniref:Uncharacterized protein n=1 Tax=Eptatretus burgeri TaxID=7764 RepID=A0A8C4R100_EPTBU